MDKAVPLYERSNLLDFQSGMYNPADAVSESDGPSGLERDRVLGGCFGVLWDLGLLKHIACLESSKRGYHEHEGVDVAEGLYKEK